jgi:hypothetical protein
MLFVNSRLNGKENLDPAGGGQATSTAPGKLPATTLVGVRHLYIDIARSFSKFVATSYKS